MLKRVKEAQDAFQIEAEERFKHVVVRADVDSDEVTFACSLDTVLYVLNVKDMGPGELRVTFQRCLEPSDGVDFYETQDTWDDSLFDDAGNCMARVWNRVRESEQ